MKKKMLILLIVITSVFSILSLLGISYALFTKTIKGEKKVSIVSGTLNIDFEEGNTIQLENASSLSDEKAMKDEPYTFTIKNMGNVKAYYTISLQEDINNNTLDTSFIKYRLTNDRGYDSGVKIIRETGSGTFIVKEEDILGTSSSDNSVTYFLQLWLSDIADNSAQGKIYKTKVLVEGYSNKKRVQEEKTNAVEKLLSTYTNGIALQDYDTSSVRQQKNMYVFTHEAGEQQNGWSTDELKDYRYIGKDPNNYVTFNNETWRIIGIFTVENKSGKKEKRIKLIRKESLGNYSWDSSNAEVNNGFGVNEWSQSAIMKYLNLNYYDGSSDVVCYQGKTKNQKECPVWEEVGLKEEAQKMIEDTKWWTGSPSQTELYWVKMMTPSYMYLSERSNSNGYQCQFGGTCNDNMERFVSWIGKVGLIYPSDYGYATSGETTTLKEKCFNTPMYQWKDLSNCAENDWLYNEKTEYWAISPAPWEIYAIATFDIWKDKRVYTRTVSDPYGVIPVVYLSSNVKLLKGIGSESEPFQFGL